MTQQSRNMWECVTIDDKTLFVHLLVISIFVIMLLFVIFRQHNRPKRYFIAVGLWTTEDPCSVEFVFPLSYDKTPTPRLTLPSFSSRRLGYLLVFV
jgi:hypothetical protein